MTDAAALTNSGRVAEGLGKLESERKFIYAHARRYLDYVHGNGVRGNPNSGSLVSSDRTKTYTDPWNSDYYHGATNDAHIWYRLAKEFKSAEFLWASEQACLGGRPPLGDEVPVEYFEAYFQLSRPRAGLRFPWASMIEARWAAWVPGLLEDHRLVARYPLMFIGANSCTIRAGAAIREFSFFTNGNE